MRGTSMPSGVSLDSVEVAISVRTRRKESSEIVRRTGTIYKESRWDCE